MRVSPHRDSIIALFNNNQSSGTIAKLLGAPRSTVCRIIKQVKEVGHVLEKPKCGRPRSVNVPRIRNIIKKRINRNDGLSMNKVASDLQIARSTVQNIVKKEFGFRSYRLLTGQTLTDNAMINRAQKARKLLRTLTSRRLDKVLFTDEKVFTVEVAKNPQNHRQLLSSVDKNSRKRRIRTRTLFPKSVMVWGGICATGKTPLVFIKKGVKINAAYYQDEILKKVVLPWSSVHFQNNDMILQQDWAPAHGAKTTMELCDRIFPGHLGKDLWPSNSPDLNPLDFSVWSVLEEKVSAKPHQSLDSLKKALTKAWEELDTDYLRRTVHSMVKRLHACVGADGGHFEQHLD